MEHEQSASVTRQAMASEAPPQDSDATAPGRCTVAWLQHLRLAVFVAVAWVWLRQMIDPTLGYFAAGMTDCPAYSPDVMFLRNHLARPGGPIEYAAAWLSQFLADPGLGALVLVLPVALAAVAVDGLVLALAGRRLAGWRSLPGMVFLFCASQYFHLLAWQLGWALGWLVAWGLVRVERPVAVRLPLAMVALAGLYYLGNGAVLITTAALALDESRRPDGRWAAVLLVGYVAALPWASTWCGFDRGLRQAYGEWLVPQIPNDALGVMHRTLSLGLPALALLLAAWALETRRKAPRELRPALVWCGWLALLAALPVLRCDPLMRDRLTLGAAAAREDWPALLAAADRLPPHGYGDLEGYLMLRALLETGGLTDSMFNYTVRPFAYLRSVDQRLYDSDWLGRRRARHGVQVGDLELRLGFVNAAEHQFHEALEISGTRPTVLLPMARVQIHKGRPAAARVFLRLAAAQWSSRAEANALLAALDQDPNLTDDAAQQELAAHELRADICAEKSITKQYETLVAEQPDHRLAVDSLMGWYLLTWQIDRLVAALPTRPAFGRTALPTHEEEAALVWEAVHHRPADLGPWHVRPATRARFEAFVAALGVPSDELGALLAEPANPPEWALKVHGGAWSNTYYHYLLFSESWRPR